MHVGGFLRRWAGRKDAYVDKERRHCLIEKGIFYGFHVIILIYERNIDLVRVAVRLQFDV